MQGCLGTIEKQLERDAATAHLREATCHCVAMPNSFLAAPHLCVSVCVSSPAVGQAFEELVLKILETPALVNAALGSGGVKLSQQAQQQQASTCSC